MVILIKMQPSMDMQSEHAKTQYLNTHQWQAIGSVGSFSLKKEGCNGSRFIAMQKLKKCLYQAPTQLTYQWGQYYQWV